MLPLLQSVCHKCRCTHNGGLNADSRRKLKQVQHLAQLIKPAIDAALKDKDQPVLADLGAGKSYLGFILYDLYFGPAGPGQGGGGGSARRTDRHRAKRSPPKAASTAWISSKARSPMPKLGAVDIVTALHACDTATDEAILFALRHEAKYVALVPCCQAELARELEGAQGPLDQLWRHPIQRREFGAHLTNVLRGLFLEAHGYKVRVTELTGLEHSLKNEFIFAERHQRSNPARPRRVRKAGEGNGRGAEVADDSID